MFFQMMHMEIAYTILRYFSRMKNPAEFILGSVASDSVYMDPCYNPEMFGHSHMLEGCGALELAECYDNRHFGFACEFGCKHKFIFRSNDYKQWRRNIKNGFHRLVISAERADYRDFAFGLCVHCMTDYLINLDIGAKLWETYNSLKNKEKIENLCYAEVRNIDWWLYRNSENTNVIMAMIADATALDIEGIVNKKDIERQKEYLLNAQYHTGETDLSDCRLMSEDDIIEFVITTANTISVALDALLMNSGFDRQSFFGSDRSRRYLRNCLKIT